MHSIEFCGKKKKIWKRLCNLFRPTFPFSFQTKSRLRKIHLSVTVKCSLTS